MSCGAFVFQAEDGIRDVAVTGVQTCALPISTERTVVMRHLDDRPLRGGGRLEWFALAEVVDRVRCRPERLVQPAIERHRRPDQRRSNRRRARSPATRVILLSDAHATQYADPRERDADARPNHVPCSTSPTIPAARINTG